jgi:phospholipid-binding lipoprotein MlaA
MTKRLLLFTLALAAPVLEACAHVPSDPAKRAEYARANDPAEPTNRVIFSGNTFLDHHLLQPIARGYEDYLPGSVQRRVRNFASNLHQPSIALNDVLQGHLQCSWITVQRFTINSTAGGAGLFDVATDWNRPGHPADFGETLAVWGAGTGPAVQLPLLGPSNVRDGIGKAADFLTNPVTLATGGNGVATLITTTSGVTGFVDNRAQLLSTTDFLEKSSVDYYAALRNVAAQQRAALVTAGKSGCPSSSVPPLPKPKDDPTEGP